MVSSGQNSFTSFKYLSDEETWINMKIQGRTCPKQVKIRKKLLVLGLYDTSQFLSLLKKATDARSQMCVYQLLMPTPNTKHYKKKTGLINLHTNNASHIKQS